MTAVVEHVELRKRVGLAAQRARVRYAGCDRYVARSRELVVELVAARAAGVSLEDLATIVRLWSGCYCSPARVAAWVEEVL